MIDIIPHVKELLTPLGAQTEQGYSDTRVSFPLIVLTVPSNVATTSGKTEGFTRITVQDDVYTADKDDTFALAQKVDEIMTANGFTRTMAEPFTEGGAERFMMHFSCAVNFTHKHIITN